MRGHAKPKSFRFLTQDKYAELKSSFDKVGNLLWQFYEAADKNVGKQAGEKAGKPEGFHPSFFINRRLRLGRPKTPCPPGDIKDYPTGLTGLTGFGCWHFQFPDDPDNPVHPV